MGADKMKIPGDITPKQIAEIRDMLRDLDDRLKHDRLDPDLRKCLEEKVSDLLARLPEEERREAIEETLDGLPVSGVLIGLEKVEIDPNSPLGRVPEDIVQEEKNKVVLMRKEILPRFRALLEKIDNSSFDPVSKDGLKQDIRTEMAIFWGQSRVLLNSDKLPKCAVDGIDEDIKTTFKQVEDTLKDGPARFFDKG